MRSLCKMQHQQHIMHGSHSTRQYAMEGKMQGSEQCSQAGAHLDGVCRPMSRYILVTTTSSDMQKYSMHQTKGSGSMNQQPLAGQRYHHLS